MREQLEEMVDLVAEHVNTISKQAAEIERLRADSGVAERSESELCKIIDEREAEIERLKEELKDLGHELREVQER